MFRLFAIGVIGALVVIGLGYAYQSLLSSSSLPLQAGVAKDEGYCCMANGTCAVSKKTDCSSFFLQDQKACEARCTGAR